MKVMITQADVLMVNHGHSYIDYVCAMCFSEHVEMFVIVSGAAIWVYATNYLTMRAGVRQMIQEASETGFLKDGHVIMLSLIGYKLNKQTNQRTHLSTLINRSLDRMYFYENLLIIVSHMQTANIGKFHILELIISGFMDFWLYVNAI